jgi:signal transduction histidine kinase
VTAPLLLNVNDHVANLYMVTKILRNAGYRVIEARTGEDAIALAQNPNDKPDLIVLDVRLPDMTGFEVCRLLKNAPATQDIKILHTSATYISSDNKIEGLEAGADGYLTQPFEPQDLIATVRSLIRLHEVELDLQERNTTLVEADVRKNQFLAMLAHELRNPLAAIQSSLPLLSRFPARDELEEKTLGVLTRQTANLVQLVNDLLDVSRVTRGRIDLHMTTLDFVPLVREVAEGMRERVFAPRHQKLVVEIPSTPVMINADAGRLEQVITNLLDNASKYSDSNTVVTIQLAVTTNGAELSVRDQGVGVDPSVLPTMFDLFAQAPTSLARARGGLGIGLTLVKALVELHDGTIVAESAGIGMGTEMRLTLPTTTRVSAAKPTPRTPEVSPRRILVIDDNDDARALFRAILELDGHVVDEAADGPTGVDVCGTFEPDIAFVDIGLPGFDGFEVARRIRKNGGKVPRLIALSGYGADEHRESAAEAGFDEHVIKPIDPQRLASILASS